MAEPSTTESSTLGSSTESVLIDLHTHSSERSLDSGVRALTLARRAAEVGLAGICLTDHNETVSPDEARILGEQAEITVIPGMEVGTDIGHVLVYGLDRFRPELIHVEQLRRIVLSEGAVMVWAHPMRDMRLPRPDWEALPELFDALEVINGDHIDRDDGYVAGLAQQYELGQTAGSDAHSVQAIGRVATQFAAPVPNLEALIAALRAQTTTALTLA